MADTLLTVRTDTKVKKEAAKVAESLGFTLSSLVNAYLRKLIKTKRVDFAESYEPTPYLKRLIKQAEKEYKEGKTLSFKNPADALRYVDSLIDSK